MLGGLARLIDDLQLQIPAESYFFFTDRMAPGLIAWAFGQTYVSFISGSLLDDWIIFFDSPRVPYSGIHRAALIGNSACSEARPGEAAALAG